MMVLWATESDDLSLAQIGRLIFSGAIPAAAKRNLDRLVCDVWIRGQEILASSAVSYEERFSHFFQITYEMLEWGVLFFLIERCI
jgi:hypothetical protein